MTHRVQAGLYRLGQDLPVPFGARPGKTQHHETDFGNGAPGRPRKSLDQPGKIPRGIVDSDDILVRSLPPPAGKESTGAFGKETHGLRTAAISSEYKRLMCHFRSSSLVVFT
jgi:hypothetical protein